MDFEIPEWRLRSAGETGRSKADGKEFIRLSCTLRVGVAASGLDFSIVLPNGDELGTVNASFEDDE